MSAPHIFKDHLPRPTFSVSTPYARRVIEHIRLSLPHKNTCLALSIRPAHLQTNTLHLLDPQTIESSQDCKTDNIMASREGDNLFGVLGSSKLNTSDGKDPTSSTTAAAQMQEAKGSTTSDDEHRRQCQKAHDDLEARLKDEELHGRSRGWNS